MVDRSELKGDYRTGLVNGWGILRIGCLKKAQRSSYETIISSRQNRALSPMTGSNRRWMEYNVWPDVDAATRYV